MTNEKMVARIMKRLRDNFLANRDSSQDDLELRLEAFKESIESAIRRTPLKTRADIKQNIATIYKLAFFGYGERIVCTQFAKTVLPKDILLLAKRWIKAKCHQELDAVEEELAIALKDY